MGHSIYGKPVRKLESITASLYLPTRETNFTSSMVVQGWSRTQRSSLWSYSEKFDDPVHANALSIVDAAHHLLLIGVQDRPNAQELLDHLVKGGEKYEDQPLPF